jgi:hypothetical protein
LGGRFHARPVESSYYRWFWRKRKITFWPLAAYFDMETKP